jgi:uncharacterized membrane protein YfcA
LTSWYLLAPAGFLAGVINAIAGGGSLVSFPALLLTGMPAVTANATNSLAVWPGSITATIAYRERIAEERAIAWRLTWPSLLGGLLGSVILLHTSDQLFRAIVPWLILFACALLALQGPAVKLFGGRIPRQKGRVPLALWLAQFAIAIYGGYFGAGMGILMLAGMSIVIPDSLQHANALKILFGMLINGMAVAYFLLVGAAALPEAALMAASSLVGGYVGAHLAQRMPARLMRTLVVLYGIGIAIRLFLPH